MNIGKQVAGGAGKVAGGAGNIAKTAGRMATSAVKDVGKTVASTAVNAGKTVGSNVVNVTQTVGKTTGNITKTVASTAVNTTKSVASTAVNTAQNVVSTTGNVAKTVATTGASAAIGIGAGGAGIIGNTLGGALRMTMINPRRRGKYSGGRRMLKKQDSRLAWESRVTAPCIKLDLIIECQNLPKKSSFEQSDSFCVVWEIPSGHRQIGTINKKKVTKLPAKHEKEIGRTEVCRESKNPKFTKTLRLEYKFQEEQYYVIRVYNEDLQYSSDLKEHDYIGGCIFSLGELMGAGGCSIARPLTNHKKERHNNGGTENDMNLNNLSLHNNKSNHHIISKNTAYLIIVGQEIIETREVLEFRFSGQDLGSLEKKRNRVQVAKEFIGTIEKVNVAKQILDKFNLYFQLQKLNQNDLSWEVVWKSEVVKDNKNPTWLTARIPLQSLCDSDDPDTPIRINIYDWNRSSPDELVGFVETSITNLTQQMKRGIPVLNVRVEKNRLLRGLKLKKAGILKVLKANVLQIPSMLQFISGGCRMDLVFAVDCTIANGDWRDESSQHYHSSAFLNDYQAAIHKIATVFQGFEGEKDYGLWGYGAIINNIKVDTYFSMGKDLTNADKLVEAYDKTFSDDNTLFGLGTRSNFQPVIQAAMFRANKQNKISQCYTTLVILTTGQLDDIIESIDAVCEAAEDAPLSIVIIGVGGAFDFQMIEVLLGLAEPDGKLKNSIKVPVARDVVNFLSFHDHEGNASKVVVDALREVPEQFVQYFLNAGIQPNPPKALPDFTNLDAANNNRMNDPRTNNHNNKAITNNKEHPNNNHNNNRKKNGKVSNKLSNGGGVKKKKKRQKRNNDDDDDVSDLEDDD